VGATFDAARLFYFRHLGLLIDHHHELASGESLPFEVDERSVLSGGAGPDPRTTFVPTPGNRAAICDILMGAAVMCSTMWRPHAALRTGCI
jgi:hypothetical protein